MVFESSPCVTELVHGQRQLIKIHYISDLNLRTLCTNKIKGRKTVKVQTNVVSDISGFELV